MNTSSPARNEPATPENSSPSPSALSPYYENGDQLKQKHQRSNMASGRRFESWALEQLPLNSEESVLDAGCGWGRFAWPLVEMFGLASDRVTCCDSSFGMLNSAAQEAVRRGHRPQFTAADIRYLPFPPGYFDGAMANHVLYHLSNILDGIRELARVVKKEGWLLATTNSDEVSVPVLEYHYAALDELEIDYCRESSSPFSMENGRHLLECSFANVRSLYFDDETLYHSADEFLAGYRTIGRYRNLLARADVSRAAKKRLPRLVRAKAEETIRTHGVLRSPVRMGAFVCREPLA